MLSRNDFEYQVTPMQREDVPATVEVHRRVFPDYFLTHMGREFLELFYAHLITGPGYGFVARHNGQIFGFSAGTAAPEQFYQGFYRQNFPALFRIVIVRLLMDPYIRRSIWRRASHLRHVGRAMLRSRLAKRDPAQTITGAEPKSHGAVHLLSIGVADDFRGQGVAEALAERFCRAAEEEGKDLVRLSVLPGNARAVRFYKRTGWQLVQESDTSLVFSRSLK